MERNDNISEKKGDYLCYLWSFFSDTYRLTLNPKQTRLVENLRREYPKMAKTSENEKESLSATELGEQLSISKQELEMANCHNDNLETEPSPARDQILDLEA